MPFLKCEKPNRCSCIFYKCFRENGCLHLHVKARYHSGNYWTMNWKSLQKFILPHLQNRNKMFATCRGTVRLRYFKRYKVPRLQRKFYQVDPKDDKSTGIIDKTESHVHTPHWKNLFVLESKEQLQNFWSRYIVPTFLVPLVLGKQAESSYFTIVLGELSVFGSSFFFTNKDGMKQFGGKGLACRIW